MSTVVTVSITVLATLAAIRAIRAVALLIARADAKMHRAAILSAENKVEHERAEFRRIHGVECPPNYTKGGALR